jgi:uncharacterized protein (DUF2252 family)
MGQAARLVAPRSGHGAWEPAADRPDPIALLAEQAASRVPELVPIRHGRMLVSPFAFFRGAALIMASDLAATADSGLIVQACGDAHLSNFGLFGSPERQLMFDINDFDETLSGPREWDVKRLAASFQIAGRDRGFAAADRASIVLASVRGYRERIRATAEMSALDAWYDHVEVRGLADWIAAEGSGLLSKQDLKGITKNVAKARTRDSMRAFGRLTHDVDGERRIIADPPLIVPIEDLTLPGTKREQIESTMRQLVLSYRQTVEREHHPFEQFQYVHAARKVVGVGSVGTRAWILLLLGRDGQDPLFLQAKEAQPSVLERFVGRSQYSHSGRRVVVGQRLMQGASDIFLGWQRVKDVDGQTRDYYVRQLHDWKGSIEVDSMQVSAATIYARLCGATLARAHARSGDRIAIASYLGKADTFDRAIASFATTYADQNERDYAALVHAVQSGRLVAQTGM